MDVAATEMLAENPAAWADGNKIKLQAGTWSFEERSYLVEPMQWSMFNRMGKAPRRMAIMKAAQGGYTEAIVNEILHGLIYKHYPRGVLYLFPTTDDVREFSKARFGPLIAANPGAIGQYVTDVQSRTDTATLKKVHDAMLYLRGATMTLQLSVGGKDAAKLRGIPVDKLIIDELDACGDLDFGMVEMASARLDASKVKQEVYLANPTIPDRGISKMYQKGDQRHWFRYCPCGTYTSAEVEWPNLIRKDKDGKGYIACKKCGKPVAPNAPGSEWVPAERENSSYMWSYHWSQLTSTTNDPAEILELWTNPPNDDRRMVSRFKLGLPFVSAEDRLTVGQVLALCGTCPQLNGHLGPCAMGVDVRRHKNVVIGIRSGRNRYAILRVARLQTWDEVQDMARRFHVKSCVVDCFPYEDAARQFQKKARFRTWLCQYSESTPVGTIYNDKTGIVKVNRTEILDATHRLVASERELELPAVCPEIKQFARECAAVAKVEEISGRTRQPIFRYHKLDSGVPDDYRHALNYFYLAASGGKIAVVGDRSRPQRPTHAVNNYKRY
jgi:hypothetical protein